MAREVLGRGKTSFTPFPQKLAWWFGNHAEVFMTQRAQRIEFWFTTVMQIIPNGAEYITRWFSENSWDIVAGVEAVSQDDYPLALESELFGHPPLALETEASAVSE